MKMGANDQKKKKIPIVIHGNGILLTKKGDLTWPKEMLFQLEMNISGMTISSQRQNYSSFNFRKKKPRKIQIRAWRKASSSTQKGQFSQAEKSQK